MTYRTEETVTLHSGNGRDITLELTAIWCNSEPDVGLMSDWVDDFRITSVNGSTAKRHIAMVDRIINKNELSNDIIEEIYDGQ